jgi:hypothetical protein
MSTHNTRADKAYDALNIEQLSTEHLEDLRSEIEEELAARESNIDLDDAASADLVNDQWVKWKRMSAHANLKAVKPWMMRVTGQHDKYGVDGDWLDKTQIDDRYYMDVSDLEHGDIIKVSGASHNNRKHRYYRVLAVENGQLYYEKINESEAIETVA